MLTADDRVAGALLALDDWQVPVDAVASAIASFATDQLLYRAACSVIPEVARRFSIEEVASSYIALFEQCALGSAGEQ